MDENIGEMMAETLPFKPSWIDRINDWSETLPVKAWVIYTGSAGLLILIQLVFLLIDGGFRATELLPVIVYNGLITPAMLALYLFLDNQARIALQSMRSVLELTETEFQRYEFRLTNMPSLPVLMAGLSMLLFVVLMEQITSTPLRYATMEQLPLFNVIFQLVDKSSAVLYGIFFYHTYRQLRLVNIITSTHTRVDLFDLGPLRAFSKLTASTAVGLVAGIYGWMLINPDLLSDPFNLVFIVVFTAIALLVFVGPLVGVHRRMVGAKERVLFEIDQAFGEVFSKFNNAMRDDDLRAIEKFNGIIASLETQQRKIESIPTWPWRPETVRPVLSAIAVPVFITIVQFIIDLLLN